MDDPINMLEHENASPRRQVWADGGEQRTFNWINDSDTSLPRVSDGCATGRACPPRLIYSKTMYLCRCSGTAFRRFLLSSHFLLNSRSA